MKKLTFFILLVIAIVSFQCSSQQLVYLTNRSGNFDIYLSDAKGKTHQQLTTNTGWDWYPKWNDTKNGIIYNSNKPDGAFSILLMDKAGNPQPLETFGKEEFILSPDGQKFLYTVRDSQYSYIYLFDLKKEMDIPLITVQAYNGRPKWSPNGNEFCFISDRNGSNEIYLYKLASNQTIKLTDNKNAS